MTWRDLRIAEMGRDEHGRPISVVGHPDKPLLVKIDGQYHHIRSVKFESDAVIFVSQINTTDRKQDQT